MVPRRSKPPLFTRLIALTSATLVVVLAILASSPDLHHALHRAVDLAGHPHDCRHHSDSGDASRPLPPASGDELCIVTEFAAGHADLVAAPAFFAFLHAAAAGDVRPAREFGALSAPAHTLPPGCGPPLA